ncbi:MAG: Gfo/Idh/MocA family protein [Eubacteriales bacterium]
MEKIRIGMIGFGGRGYGLLRQILLPRENVIVTAVCDLYPDRAERAAAAVEEQYGKRPLVSTDYHDVTSCADVDAVVISSAWESHIEIAVSAMENGKYTATEVGGAYSLADCFRLVETYERTGMHCMMLENCCYDRMELMVTRMVREGLFGEIVHCAGGYQHDLRSEIAFGEENRHYRLRNYTYRNCENYPTHELGPIAKLLDINRGNRMLTLTSMASGAHGLHEYIRQNEKANKELLGTSFAQGDVVTTVIRCARGQTITLTLDTTLPRYYCRGFTVRGTKGMYEETTNSIFLDGQDNGYDFKWHEKWGCAKDYLEKYEHPIWDRFLHDGVRGGHGGIDWLVFDAFLGAVERGITPPIDTYDTASWMAITPLSEESISLGGAPVAIPDFTHGAWTHREQPPVWEYTV